MPQDLAGAVVLPGGRTARIKSYVVGRRRRIKKGRRTRVARRYGRARRQIGERPRVNLLLPAARVEANDAELKVYDVESTVGSEGYAGIRVILIQVFTLNVVCSEQLLVIEIIGEDS